jgi:hypothetical protein
MVPAHVLICQRLAHLRKHAQDAVMQLRQYVEATRLRTNPFGSTPEKSGPRSDTDQAEDRSLKTLRITISEQRA